MINPADQKVLIVAPDPLVAALVGALVELSSLRAAFPRADERAEAALNRVKPLAAVLVDATADEAASDLFLARARKRGIHVLVFGAAEAVAAHRAWAASNRVPAYALPADIPAMEQGIRNIAEYGPAARLIERRDMSAREGIIVFSDRDGRRWSVYDRRTGDRRKTVVEREFVSNTGEVRRCQVSEVEAALTTIEALTGQLARASLETRGEGA